MSLHDFLYSYDPTDYYGDTKACIALLALELILTLIVVGIYNVA